MLVPDDRRVDAVAQWQLLLVHLGYDLGRSLSLDCARRDGSDGRFGPRTLAVTTRFQDEYPNHAGIRDERGTVGIYTLLAAAERLRTLHAHAMDKVDERDITHRHTLAEVSRLLRDALDITNP